MSKAKKLKLYTQKYTSKNKFGYWILIDLKIKAAQQSKTSAEVNTRKSIQLIKLIGNEDITEHSQSKCDVFMSEFSLKYAPSTYNDYRTILSDTLERAVNDNVIDKNPYDNVKTAKGASTPIKVFKKEDIARLTPTNKIMTVETAIVTLALSTGVRINELIGITASSYIAEDKALYIEETIVAGEVKSTKTDSSTRKVDLNKHGIKSLEFLINLTKNYEETTYDFYVNNKVYEKRKNIFIVINPQTRKRFTSSEEFRKKFFQPYCEEVGVNYLPPKNLRHTFISQMLTAGAPLTWIIKQVGHMNYEMIKKHYGKWINEDSSKSQKLISDHFAYLFEPKEKRSIYERIKVFLGISAKKHDCTT